METHLGLTSILNNSINHYAPVCTYTDCAAYKGVAETAKLFIIIPTSRQLKFS